MVSRAGRARALRASARDNSKVRVSVDGTRRVGPSWTRDDTTRRVSQPLVGQLGMEQDDTVGVVTLVVVSQAGRTRALRASVQDDSRVRVSVDGTRRVRPSPARRTR